MCGCVCARACVCACACVHAGGRTCRWVGALFMAPAALPPSPSHRARLRKNASLRARPAHPIACLSRACASRRDGAVRRVTDRLAVAAALRPLPKAPAAAPRPHHHGAHLKARTALRSAALHHLYACAFVYVRVRSRSRSRARARACVCACVRASATPALRQPCDMRADRISAGDALAGLRPAVQPSARRMPRCCACRRGGLSLEGVGLLPRVRRANEAVAVQRRAARGGAGARSVGRAPNVLLLVCLFVCLFEVLLFCPFVSIGLLLVRPAGTPCRRGVGRADRGAAHRAADRRAEGLRPAGRCAAARPFPLRPFPLRPIPASAIHTSAHSHFAHRCPAWAHSQRGRFPLGHSPIPT
jgi:hypothetical protein